MFSLTAPTGKLSAQVYITLLRSAGFNLPTYTILPQVFWKPVWGEKLQEKLCALHLVLMCKFKYLQINVQLAVRYS